MAAGQQGAWSLGTLNNQLRELGFQVGASHVLGRLVLGTCSRAPDSPRSPQCLAPSAMSWISWDMAVPSLLLAKQR